LHDGLTHNLVFFLYNVCQEKKKSLKNDTHHEPRSLTGKASNSRMKILMKASLA